MEVTNSNFNEVLPKIGEVINKSTFIAVDCEFSGLNVVHEINPFDSPSQYYEKVHKNCKDFLVIQYGISAFRFDPLEKTFKQQSYNFYIFRSPLNRNIPDQRFLCQSSSINFLTSQGFDFNKLFKSGISYLNMSEETSYREKLEEKHKTNQGTPQHVSNPISIPDDCQPFMDNVVKLIDNFLSGDSDELELPKCNAFVRRLVYQTAENKYKNKICLKTVSKENKDRILVATKFKSAEEKEKDEKKLLEEELTVLDNFIGFTKVLRIIIDSGKLIVGHNMCLDFIHTIDKFLTPLSPNYEEFKEVAHTLFKNVLDTKYLAASEEFKDLFTSTILKDLVTTVSKEPFQVPPIEIEEGGQGYSLDDQKEHEAGFDAYITGLSFLSMWKYLESRKNVPESEQFKDFKTLEPYFNKIYLMILRDNQYINLSGPDLTPSRDHVFYVTFPKDWKLNNITELFSPFGNVYVAWINEFSAYVALFKRDLAAVALSTLSQSEAYTVIPYAKRQAILRGAKSPVTSPVTKPINRKRPMENLSKCNNKKMKTNKFERKVVSSKFGPVIENVEAETSLKTPNRWPAREPKTFMESDAWD